MQFSSKTHYATIAMVEIARQYESQTPVPIRSIGSRHSIPIPFLTQILQQLRGAGLVTSTRGPAGGYQLSCPPSSISLATICETIAECQSFDCTKFSSKTETSKSLIKIWQECDDLVYERLRSISLQQLCDSANKYESMFYI